MPDAQGLLVPGNIDLHHRPVVKNADGTISTVRSMSVNIDGKEVLIPTVSDDGRILSNKAAIDSFLKTGRHLGMFDTPDHATAYAQQLHEDQAKEYGSKTMPDPHTEFAQKLIADDPNISDNDLAAALKLFDKQLPTRPVSAEDFAPEGSGYSLIPKNPGTIVGALKAAASSLDPRPLAPLAANIIAGSPETVGRTGVTIGKNLVMNQGRQFGKAAEDVRQGHFSEAAGHTAAGVLPVLGPAAAHAGERIGSGDVAGGLGESAAVLAPFAVGPAASLAAKGGKAVAGNLYLRALKPTKAVLEDAPAFRTGGQAAARSELAQTGLEARAPVGGARGIEKVHSGIEDLNQQIADRIAQSDMQGRVIDPVQVAKRVQDIRSKFEGQVNPQSDLAAIDQAVQEFMRHPKFGTQGGAASLLSPSEAQAMKQATYRTIGKKAYGEMGTASTEAQKGLARGLKEEVANAAPEVGPLNAQESRLISLEKALQDRARTSGNADPLKLGEQVLMAGSRPTRALFGLINRPAISSRAAIGLNELSGALGTAAPTFKAALLAMLGANKGEQP